MALLSPTAVALTNLTVNGDFESPSAPGFVTFNAPSNFLGWRVTNGGVDVVADNFYAPASGHQSLDLNSVASGSVFQDVATNFGQAYLFVFSFAANPLPDNPAFPSPAIKIMEARWNGTVLGTFVQDTTGHTASNVGWLDYAFGVFGTGVDRITFTSLTVGSAGPAIDNIRLWVVPEPSTFVLLSGSITLRLLVRRGCQLVTLPVLARRISPQSGHEQNLNRDYPQ
ncbi:DUF642 domain-containing protein [Bythopirellula polymerisocia]|uniref:DUF642 domain-containing protein n=1 Tax=Bythopirellula polymerisocia TaxID=2528003 RepID=UPI0018D2DF30|nr:DUF642 domain-containing protein [Bythopirellula polymerisocia]